MDLRRYLPLGLLAVAAAALQVGLSAFGVQYYLTQLTMAAGTAVDRLILPAHTATMDDCCRLQELLLEPSVFCNIDERDKDDGQRPFVTGLDVLR